MLIGYEILQRRQKKRTETTFLPISAAQRIVLEKIGKKALDQILGVSGRISAASKKSVKRRPISFSKTGERFPGRFVRVALARLQYDGPMRRLERRTPFLQRSRYRFRKRIFLQIHILSPACQPIFNFVLCSLPPVPSCGFLELTATLL